MQKQHRLHIPDDVRRQSTRLARLIVKAGWNWGVPTVRAPHVERHAMMKGLELLEKELGVKVKP